MSLPVASIDNNLDADSPNESDEDYSDVFTKEEAAEIYLDWLSELDKNDVRMMVVMVFDTFMQRFGLTKRGAASELARLLDKNEKTIRKCTVVPALESISINLIRKYFRKARDYMRAYREGHASGKELEKAVNKYKSHRRIPLMEVN